MAGRDLKGLAIAISTYHDEGGNNYKQISSSVLSAAKQISRSVHKNTFCVVATDSAMNQVSLRSPRTNSVHSLRATDMATCSCVWSEVIAIPAAGHPDCEKGCQTWDPHRFAGVVGGEPRGWRCGVRRLV